MTMPGNTVEYLEKNKSLCIRCQCWSKSSKVDLQVNQMKLIREEIESVDFLVEEKKRQKVDVYRRSFPSG